MKEEFHLSLNRKSELSVKRQLLHNIQLSNLVFHVHLDTVK